MKYRIFCLLLLVYALILGGCSSQENNSKDGDISENECANFEKEVEMLQQCTFVDVKCLYFYHKFSVITAVKKSE